MKKPLSFVAVIAKLEARYEKPRRPITTDPVGILIHEAVAYLASDEKRDAAFTAFRHEIGFRPTEILAAPLDDLVRITKLGGIHADLRAARLQEIARIVLYDFAGDLNQALHLPLPQAMKALQSYPILALESNGLRVLLRLGFAEERKDYTASYRAIREALKDQIGDDCDFLIRAHQLLRQHGKETCHTNNPACEICPVKSECAYFQGRRV
jgi:endonuclease III